MQMMAGLRRTNNIAENALRMVSLGRKNSCSSVRIMEESGERCCTA
ncbi:transposase [Shigella dysenteriae 225-75]|nr:transposase [Shigella dysenteriae 225-75]